MDRNNCTFLPYLIPKVSDCHGSYRSNDGLLHHLIVKCSNVLEEYTASIFRVKELVQVDAEVTQRTV